MLVNIWLFLRIRGRLIAAPLTTKKFPKSHGCSSSLSLVFIYGMFAFSLNSKTSLDYLNLLIYCSF